MSVRNRVCTSSHTGTRQHSVAVNTLHLVQWRASMQEVWSPLPPLLERLQCLCESLFLSIFISQSVWLWSAGNQPCNPCNSLLQEQCQTVKWTKCCQCPLSNTLIDPCSWPLIIVMAKSSNWAVMNEVLVNSCCFNMSKGWGLFLPEVTVSVPTYMKICMHEKHTYAEQSVLCT